MQSWEGLHLADRGHAELGGGSHSAGGRLLAGAMENGGSAGLVGDEEPRPSRRGLLTIQAALDPSPARLGAGHSAESSPR